MTATPDSADPGGDRRAYRLRRGRLPEATVELWDDVTQRCVVATSFKGKAVFATLVIRGATGSETGASVEARPNRRVMPTRWTIEESGQKSGRKTGMKSGEPLAVIEQAAAGKLLNPWSRSLLSLTRRAEVEPYLVIDARANGFGRWLNLEGDDWVMVRGDTPVARFAWLARPKAPDVEGSGQATRSPKLLGKLRRRLADIAATDLCLVSAGDAHALSAAESLALLLYLRELTESS